MPFSLPKNPGSSPGKLLKMALLIIILYGNNIVIKSCGTVKRFALEYFKQLNNHTESWHCYKSKLKRFCALSTRYIHQDWDYEFVQQFRRNEWYTFHHHFSSWVHPHPSRGSSLGFSSPSYKMAVTFQIHYGHYTCMQYTPPLNQQSIPYLVIKVYT